MQHKSEGNKQETEMAIVTAIQLLRSLYSISLQDNIIEHTNIPVFYDKDCTIPVSDMTAIVVKQIMVDGLTPTIGVFPTTRTDYKVGEHVTWDWNKSRILRDVWYKDPTTAETKPINAMEFVGSDIDDL